MDDRSNHIRIKPYSNQTVFELNDVDTEHNKYKEL